MMIFTQRTLGSLFSRWSLSQKILAGYGLAFTVTITGIITGLTLSNQAERKALAIEAEAIEDVENISDLQGSLLKLIVHQDSLLAELNKTIEDSYDNLNIESATGQIQTKLINFQEVYEAFAEAWQEFQESDEFEEEDDDEDAEDRDGVTETEAEIAASILEDHQASVNDYLRQVNSFLESVDPSILTPELIFQFQEEVVRLNQSDFIVDLDSFIDKIVALAEATQEEQQEAIEVLARASATQIKIILTSILLSGLTGLFLMYIISRILLRPLEEITQTTTQSIQQKNFDLAVTVSSQDEVGVLAQTFNAYMQFVKELLTKSETTNQKLKATLKELNLTQAQMIQQEKMSSLGQLVAGIAHEINNPVNFIHGNLTHVEQYSQDLLKLVELYQQQYPNPGKEIERETEEIDLEFIQTDLPKTISSMKIGSDRIREIVLALRIFSRLQEAEVKAINIHEGLDSTLMILQHRLKASPERAEIQVIKDFGQLPLVECFSGLLNQVFMNILSNAIDALEDLSTERTAQKPIQHPSQIKISTALVNEKWVKIAIADNGIGIPQEIQQQIFDPFFTTKPVGKGTGMGMSISYQIITERHHGKLECFSTEGQGTEFVILIPVQLKKADATPESLPQTNNNRLLQSQR
ncbi:MAG: ATP-binding protein [Cyanobacteriota bacterium]|nr:ATP-binding protein [Cyanobacteriota bacterium]